MTRTTTLLCLLFSCLASYAETPSSSSLLDCYQFESGQEVIQYLPAELREVSGLAITPNNTLLAHNDERTAVYELKHQTGQLITLQTDSSLTSSIDHEGIALAGANLFLVSSKGNFARTRYPLNEAPFDYWKSKLNKVCEIEGLTENDRDQTLVLACKKIKEPRSKREIRLLIIQPGVKKAEPGKISTIIPKHHESGIKEFSGSGVAYDEELNHYLVLSSNKPAIAELNDSGDLLKLIALPKKLHRQPEGIAVTRDKKLIIANEGGKGQGYLVTYTPRDRCSTDGGLAASDSASRE